MSVVVAVVVAYLHTYICYWQCCKTVAVVAAAAVVSIEADNAAVVDIDTGFVVGCRIVDFYSHRYCSHYCFVLEKEKL